MKNKRPNIFTVIDLEMAQPSRKIIQIGACVGDIETGEILDRLSVFVNPNETLSAFIINLTKIKQEDVDSGVSLLEAYNRLKEMHLKHGSFTNSVCWGGGDAQDLRNQLILENPSFNDWCFGRRWIDVKTIYIACRLANDKPITGGLSKAMSKFKLQFQGQAHNAMWDSVNTFYIYTTLLKQFKTD